METKIHCLASFVFWSNTPFGTGVRRNLLLLGPVPSFVPTFQRRPGRGFSVPSPLRAVSKVYPGFSEFSSFNFSSQDCHHLRLILHRPHRSCRSSSDSHTTHVFFHTRGHFLLIVNTHISPVARLPDTFQVNNFLF